MMTPQVRPHEARWIRATPAVARVRSRPVILVPCGEWYWWMRGRWMNRRHAVVPFGRSRRDVAFVSLG